MQQSYIEFYCRQQEFLLVLSVPAMRQQKVYRLTKMKDPSDKHTVRYIVCCDSITDAKDLISSIRAWLKYEHRVLLSDPEREVLMGDGSLWAQLIKKPFDPQEYDMDFSMEQMQ